MTTHTDPFKSVFSPSSVQLYMECPRKFYYRYILKVGKRGTSLPLDFGKIIHEAIAELYRTKGDLKLSILKFTELWEKENFTGDEKRNLVNAISILEKYRKAYNDFSDYKPEMIEIAGENPMDNGTTCVYRLDRISQLGSRMTIADTKHTTKPLTDYYWNQYDNDFQMGAYFYLSSKLFGSSIDIMIDAIHVPYKVSMDLQRRVFPKTDLQIKEWENTYNKETEEIISRCYKAKSPDGVLPESFCQRQTSCSNYGGCPYLQVCMYGLNHPVVETEFVKLEERD